MKDRIPIRPAVTRYISSPRYTKFRHFTTTCPRTIYVKHALRRVLPKDQSVIPNYPYGPSRWFKQSNKGLYGGLFIQHGNNVGKKFAVKTRRTWHPNIQPHLLYSRALARPIRLRVATRVLRTIDKLGGLDEYLVGSSTRARLRELGVTGWALRWRVLQTRAMRKRFGITLAERDWLGVAREAVASREQEVEDEGRSGIPQQQQQQQRGKETGGEVLEGKEGRGEEVEVDEATQREVEAFDRVLDEEDRKAEMEERGETDTVGREDEKAPRRTSETERAPKRERPPRSGEVHELQDSEMIQETPGVMNRLKGILGRR